MLLTHPAGTMGAAFLLNTTYHSPDRSGGGVKLWFFLYINSELESRVLQKAYTVLYNNKCEADNHWKTIRINPASIILRRKGKTTNLQRENGEISIMFSSMYNMGK